MGVPVEMANETLPSIWRLREMQQFISTMRSEPTHRLSIHDLVEMKNAIPANRWTDLIAEGIAALAHELNTGHASAGPCGMVRRMGPRRPQ